MNIDEKIIYIGYSANCWGTTEIAQELKKLRYTKGTHLFNMSENMFSQLLFYLRKSPNVVNTLEYVLNYSPKPDLFLVDFISEHSGYMLDYTMSFVIYNEFKDMCFYAMLDEFNDYYVKSLDSEFDVIIKQKSTDIEIKERKGFINLTPLYKNIFPSNAFTNKRESLIKKYDVQTHNKKEGYTRLTFHKK